VERDQISQYSAGGGGGVEVPHLSRPHKPELEISHFQNCRKVNHFIQELASKGLLVAH